MSGLDVTGLGGIADLAKSVVSRIWPDKTEEEKTQLAAQMQEAMNDFNLAKGQLDANIEEAKSPNWFVAGWRPYIGWTCGGGLSYQYVLLPFLTWLSVNFHLTAPPALDTSTLYQLLLALLGMGGLRTYEKFKGVVGNH